MEFRTELEREIMTFYVNLCLFYLLLSEQFLSKCSTSKLHAQLQNPVSLIDLVVIEFN